MVKVLDPNWPTNGYSPLTAKDISEQVGIDGRVGRFIISEYEQYLSERKPVDRFGYPAAMGTKEIEGWRKYELMKVVRAVETIGNMYKR